MENLLSQLKDLEKTIERAIDKAEDLESSGTLGEIGKDLDEFKIFVEKAKGINYTKHEEVYLRQYVSSHQKLRARYLALKRNVESQQWSKELIGSQNSIDTDSVEILINEGKSLDNSLSISQSIINSAQEVKASLAYQKEKVMGTSDKIVRFVEMVPGINTMIGKVSRRKRFNAIVIGLALCVCLIITSIYVL